ncbi:MAG TPA: ABC transporter permease [Pseudonocardiaceae bacterium]|nr:ABC transporter permease [Pseudonocardiaceae bacterium]
MSAGLSPVRVVALVIRREFLNRVRTRAFVVGTLVLVVILGGYLAFITFIGGQGNRGSLGVATEDAALIQPLRAAASALGKDLQIREVGIDAGRRQVNSGDLDALLVGEPGSYQLIGKSQVDDSIRGLVQGTIAQQAITSALIQAGVDAPALAARNQVAATTLNPHNGDYSPRIAIGLISGGLLYFAILIYGSSLAQSVLEEKTSRVIELLLATMRPWQLMTGKIIGVGGAGLLQFTLIAVIGAIGATLTGLLRLPAATAVTALAGLGWFLLGFLLYATIYTASGSLVSRPEDLQAVLAPASVLIVIPFAASFSIITNPTGTIAVALSLVPFFSPILMPVLIALGAASAWQVIASVILTGATTVVLAALGGRVYANSVLRTGNRVRLRDALSRTP